jgi:hypothetical protein
LVNALASRGREEYGRTIYTNERQEVTRVRGRLCGEVQAVA